MGFVRNLFIATDRRPDPEASLAASTHYSNRDAWGLTRHEDGLFPKDRNAEQGATEENWQYAHRGNYSKVAPIFYFTCPDCIKKYDFFLMTFSGS